MSRGSRSNGEEAAPIRTAVPARAMAPDLGEILQRHEVADALGALSGLLGAEIDVRPPLGREFRFGSGRETGPSVTRQVYVGGQRVTLAFRRASLSGQQIDEAAAVVKSFLAQAYSVDDLAAGTLYANEQLEHVLRIVSKTAAWHEIDAVASELLRQLHRQFDIDRAFAVVERAASNGPRVWVAARGGDVSTETVPGERWKRLKEEVLDAAVEGGSTKWEPEDVPSSVLDTLGIQARPTTPILTSPLGTSRQHLGLVGVKTLSAFSFGSIEAQWLEVILTAAAGTMAALAFFQADVAFREASAAHKAVTEASAMAAHKLGNPTAALLAQIHFWEEDLAAGKEIDTLASDLAHMRTSVERIQQVTHEFKNLVATPPVTRRQVDLASLVKEVVGAQVVRPYRLIFDAPAHAWGPFSLDPSLSRSVFEEIVANAKQAMPKGGTIRVSFTGPHQAATGPAESMNQDYVTVAVTDEGPGVPPGQRDEIFKPFVTTRAGGTGLGLPIVRRYVELLGGSVQAESAPNSAQGAVFRVALPASPA